MRCWMNRIRNGFKASGEFFSAVMIGILIPIFAFAATPVYVVKAGETLSQILGRLTDARIYGKNGALASVLKLNDELAQNLGNLIYPGEVIVLPENFQWTEARAPLAPSSGRVPAAEAAVAASDDDFEVQGQFSLGLGLDFFRVDATDLTTGSTSTILSNLSPSLLLGYRLQWNHELAFVVNAVFERYNFQVPKNMGFDHDSGIRSGFAFGGAYRMSDALEILVSAALQERIFFHSNSLTELAVDRVMVVAPNLAFRYRLLSKPGAQVGVDGEVGYYAPASNSYYDVHSGYHYGFGLFLDRRPKNSSHGFEVGLSYGYDRQNTSVLNESEKKFLLKLIYHFDD